MPITRFPMTIIKNEECLEDPDGPLSLHQAVRAHKKQSIKGQPNNIHSLSGGFHQKHHATISRAGTEKDFHHHHFHLQSPEPSRISVSSPMYQTTGSLFPPPSRSSQLPQYPYNSPPVENQIYKTEPQESTEGPQLAHGLDNFVNMYAQQQQHHQQQQGQRQTQQPNTSYPVNNMATPLTPWGHQSSPSRIFMNNTRPPTESSESTPAGNLEQFDNPNYIDGTFAPPQEAWSFTWDMKEDRTIVERNKPKRRKLTPSERARTKALKLAGGACDNCRRKKKKCTHKDLSNINSLGEGQQTATDGDLARRHNQPPTVIDRDIQSRIYTYSGPGNSVLAYMKPEDDPGMHTPSATPPYVEENANVPEFPLDSAGLGQQFDHQGRPSNYDQGHQGDQEGGDDHHDSSIWYNVMGYNADYISHQYYQD